MGGDIGEDLATDVLLADVPGGRVGEANGHRGMEHATAIEKVFHPSTAEEVGHDGFGIGDAIGLG